MFGREEIGGIYLGLKRGALEVWGGEVRSVVGPETWQAVSSSTLHHQPPAHKLLAHK